MKKTTLLLTLLLSTSLMASSSNSQAQQISLEYIEKIELQNRLPSVLEKEALLVLNKFVHILQTNDFKNSSQMVTPLIHKSLLTQDRSRLDEDTLRFSFKKAHPNAKHYAYPVKVTRIDRLKSTEIGHGNTHEVGVEFKMWIAKKNAKGYSAPLVLFFKQGGSNEPKLSYVGSI